MKSPAIKKFALKNSQKQRGVTLLLSILILAAITSIVFSLAAIALNEIRTSGDIVNSEPAITAAEAVGEDMLFQQIRGFNTNCTASSMTALSNSNVQVNTYISYYNANPFIYDAAPSQENDYYLYRPCNQSQNPAYTSLTVQIANVSSASASVHVCTWTLATCSSAGDITNVTVNAGGSTTVPLDPSTKYQLVIINGSVAVPVSVSVVTNDVSVTGLPSGITTIYTTATKNGVTRKVQTTIPQ